MKPAARLFATPSHVAIGRPGDDERQRPEPGGEGGRERDREDEEHLHRRPQCDHLLRPAAPYFSAARYGETVPAGPSLRVTRSVLSAAPYSRPLVLRDHVLRERHGGISCGPRAT